jgi:hypothetical protein
MSGAKPGHILAGFFIGGQKKWWTGGGQNGFKVQKALNVKR